MEDLWIISGKGQCHTLKWSWNIYKMRYKTSTTVLSINIVNFF